VIELANSSSELANSNSELANSNSGRNLARWAPRMALEGAQYAAAFTPAEQ